MVGDKLLIGRRGGHKSIALLLTTKKNQPGFVWWVPLFFLIQLQRFN